MTRPAGVMARAREWVRGPVSSGRGSASRAGLAAIAAKLAGAGLGLLINVVVARQLGAEQFGLFVLGITAASLLSMLASFGLPFAAIRHLPDYIARGDWGGVAGFCRASLVASLAGAGLFAALLVAGSFAAGAEPGALQAFTWAAALVLPMTLAQTFASILQARGEVVLPELTQNVIRQGLTLALILLWPLLGLFVSGSGELPGVGAVLGITFVGAAVSVAVLGAMVARRAAGDPPADGGARYDLRGWAATGSAVLFILLSTSLNERLDILLLGWLVDAHDLGVYAAAVRLAVIAVLALAGLNAAYMPRISSAWAARDRDRVERLCRDVCRIGLAITALLTIGAAAGGDLVLAAFGPEFAAGRPVLVILLAAQMCVAAGGVAGGVAVITGHSRVVLAAVLTCIAVNIALILLLTPVFGITGTAFSTLVAVGGTQFAVSVICSRRLGLNVSLLPVRPRTGRMADLV